MESVFRAQKLLHDHQHPLRKVDLPPVKLLQRVSPLEETDLQNQYLDSLVEKAVNFNKVELRNSRSLGVWLSDQKLVRLTKIHGKFHYGKQNKNGRFLTPTEALYLVERNKLEVLLGEVPLSVQDIYGKVENLFTYLTYKRFLLHGFKEIINSPVTEALDETEEPNEKRRKLTHAKTSIENVQNILTFLRLKSPQAYNGCMNENHNFTFNSTKDSRQVQACIRHTDKYNIPDFNGDVSAVYAFSSSRNFGLYKFVTVDIPCIPLTINKS